MSRLALVFSICLTATVYGDHGLRPLFNGRNLDGWHQRNGTATYRVEDGQIVGKTNEGSPNSFLCTDKKYGNFELKFEVKVDTPLNSGVQIRSQTKDDKPENRVNGPQVEISNDGYAAYVYGEAAGGWMTPNEDRKGHKHFQDGEWNAYHVVAFGPTIQVWLNGKQISDLTHEEKFKSHPEGFIGLQVHGIGAGQGPYEVRWRNLYLRDLSEFTTLYNGKDLTGWKTTGNWLPQDDGSLLIQPRDGEKGWQRYDAYLWSEKKYKDFVLDVQYQYPKGGNSGLFFRVGDLSAFQNFPNRQSGPLIHLENCIRLPPGKVLKCTLQPISVFFQRRHDGHIAIGHDGNGESVGVWPIVSVHVGN